MLSYIPTITSTDNKGRLNLGSARSQFAYRFAIDFSYTVAFTTRGDLCTMCKTIQDS